MELRTTTLATAAATLILVAPAASATTMTLDYESIPVGPIHSTNQASQGFQISPNCHFDILAGPPGTQSMGYDESGCVTGGGYNAGYLGPNPDAGNVFIDLFGGIFDFVSFEHQGEPGSVRSSAGGLLAFGPSVAFNTTLLAGAAWTGINWIEFSEECPGTPCTLIDNVTFQTERLQVPTPATLPLAGLGLIALFFGFRRELNSPSPAHEMGHTPNT